MAMRERLATPSPQWGEGWGEGVPAIQSFSPSGALPAGTLIAVSSPWTGKRDVCEASPRPGRHELSDAERRVPGAGAGDAVDFAGPFRQPDRPFGLRQEHDLQHCRRAIGTELR